MCLHRCPKSLYDKKSISLCADMIIYEQPLTDLMRVMLRLEQRFQHIDVCMSQPTCQVHIQAAVSSLLSIKALLSRGDFKTKLLKKQSELIKYFSSIIDDQSVDVAQINKYIRVLNDYFNLLHGHTKMGRELEQNQLFDLLYKHISTPGGGPCVVNIPFYRYWLNHPNIKCHDDITNMVNSIDYIRKINDFMLYIIRASKNFSTQQALNGFYERNLSQECIKLDVVRIGIKQAQPILPEISVDKRRLAVQLVLHDDGHVLSRCCENQDFELALCGLPG